MTTLALQNAYCTQQDAVQEDQWQVLSVDNELLHLLPKDFTPKEAMSYLHFARPFEKRAFEQGTALGRSEAQKEAKGVTAQLELNLQILRTENERLADVLDSHINQT